MCDRECVCKSCVYACVDCTENIILLEQCRNGGIKECKYQIKFSEEDKTNEYLSSDNNNSISNNTSN